MRSDNETRLLIKKKNNKTSSIQESMFRKNLKVIFQKIHSLHKISQKKRNKMTDTSHIVLNILYVYMYIYTRISSLHRNTPYWKSTISHKPFTRPVEYWQAISSAYVIHSSTMAHEQDGSVKFDSGLPCSIIRWNQPPPSSPFLPASTQVRNSARQKWNIDRSGLIMRPVQSEYRSAFGRFPY